MTTGPPDLRAGDSALVGRRQAPRTGEFADGIFGSGGAQA
ncbi:hypothetical protein H4696_001093 [Amycolatopsis lexingtonensis]|uniref:Uncharacterized protein n=1 Tax=Amycolatopsis lexingtonensis TaxID=218822 RepID=A0ABR9HSU3_9PSEU|nr:hypothetical protein [Amycolatopsis lexingtonensis]